MNRKRYAVEPSPNVFNHPSPAGMSLQQKAEARKAEMGNLHLTHPDNQIRRVTEPTATRPVAWAVPSILSFRGMISTDAPPEVQKELEGTVTWTLSFLGDAPSVVDKFGKTHHPRALIYQDPALNNPPKPASKS